MEHEKQVSPLAGSSAARNVAVEQYDDSLPFAGLSPAEIFQMREPSRVVIGSDGAVYYRLSGPSGGLTPANGVLARKRRKGFRTPSPASSVQVAPITFQSPPVSAPVPALAPPPAPLQQPIPRRRWFSLGSVFSMFAPGLPVIIMVTSVAVAVIVLANALSPITHSVGHLVYRIADINPVQAVSSMVTPVVAAVGSIPIKDMWCNGIGIGCPGPDRNEPYTTHSFHSLDLAHPAHQISLGNDFFDCLNDLRIAREQVEAVTHLTTLATKVMQFQHVLERPEELSENVLALARAREDIVVHANAARVSGSIGVGKIVGEFNTARWMTAARVHKDQIRKEIVSGLTSAQRSLQETADSTTSSQRALKSAKELHIIVSEQAHKEISRLRKINNEKEVGLAYLAYGWTEFSWKWVQPGLKGLKDDRILAGGFLKELVRVVDLTAQTLLVNSLSLQQCAANTITFNEQIERAFSFERLNIPLHAHIEHLLPGVQSLGHGLSEMKSNDASLRLAGPSTTNTQSPPTVQAAS